jgi:hypothetical protein
MKRKESNEWNEWNGWIIWSYNYINLCRINAIVKFKYGHGLFKAFHLLFDECHKLNKPWHRHQVLGSLCPLEWRLSFWSRDDVWHLQTHLPWRHTLASFSQTFKHILGPVTSARDSQASPQPTLWSCTAPHERINYWIYSLISFKVDHHDTRK